MFRCILETIFQFNRHISWKEMEISIEILKGQNGSPYEYDKKKNAK